VHGHPSHSQSTVPDIILLQNVIATVCITHGLHHNVTHCTVYVLFTMDENVAKKSVTQELAAASGVSAELQCGAL